MSKIPLKTRKSIKAALDAADTHSKKASAAFGKELTFEDNTSDLFEKLQAAGKSEDYLFGMGALLATYMEQFSKVICDFCKDPANKEQLQAELSTGKFGVKITDEDTNEYWRLEEGRLWMLTTPNYFGSYLSYFDVDRLTKKLGKSDSMPLNTRKNLANAAKEIEKSVATASKAFGKEIAWVDNYQELYDKLKEAGKSEDFLWTMGDPIKEYASQMAKIFVEFNKNSDNKEQLEAELLTGKVGLRLATEDKYWVIEDGILWMETQPNYFGSYLSYFDIDRLCKILGANDPMPLNSRKCLKAAVAVMDKSLAEASKLFGKELTMVDNYQELYDALKSAGKSQDTLFTFAKPLEDYAKQLVTVFQKFCKDNDNKEALEEVLTAGKAGVRICDGNKSTDDYWVIEDGILWMETKPNYYGSYISYFDSDRLEKKL